MEKVFRIVPYGLVIYFLLANLLLYVAYQPLIGRIRETPAGKVYFLNPIFDRYDYNYYLSAIKSGIEGKYNWTDPFTTEETKPGYFFTFYLVSGRAGSLFRLPPYIIYHLSQILAIELYFLAVYLIASLIFKRQLALWMCILAIFGTIAPLVLFGEIFAFITYIPFWIWFGSLGRLMIPPHHIFGQALLILTIFSFIKFYRTDLKKYLLTTLASLFIGGITYTPIILVFLIALPGAYLWFIVRDYFTDKHRRPQIQQVYGVILVCVFALGFGALARFLTGRGFPWNMYIDWEIEMWNNNPQFNKSLPLVFGILPLLAIPALIRSLIRNKFEEVFLVFWAVLPFMLMPFGDILGIGKFRFLTLAPSVPLAALSVKTIFQLIPRIKLTREFKIPFFQILIVGIFFFSSYVANRDLFHHSMVQAKFGPHPEEYYLTKEVWQSIKFLKGKGKQNIMVSQKMGNIIPAHTDMKTYTGHIVFTKDWSRKNVIIRDFYSGRINPENAEKLLRENKITYVYLGNEEKSYGNAVTKYPFLEEIFNNNAVIIYKLNR